jgi:hypothetical protein
MGHCLSLLLASVLSYTHETLWFLQFILITGILKCRTQMVLCRYVNVVTKSSASCFYFMLFPYRTCENFTELYYSIAASIVICWYSLHVCQLSSSTFEQEPFLPLCRSLCFLCSHLHLDHITVSLQSTFQSTEQVKSDGARSGLYVLGTAALSIQTL